MNGTDRRIARCSYRPNARVQVRPAARLLVHRRSSLAATAGIGRLAVTPKFDDHGRPGPALLVALVSR